MDQQIENKLRQLFPKLLKENLMAFNNLVVPPHRHNAVDSPQLKSGELIPYNILDIDTVQNLTEEAPNGTIGLFDFSNNTTNPTLSLRSWGILLRLSNFWNEFNIADFYIDVAKLTPQTILNGATDTVIFDSIGNQLGGNFDTTTGIFSTALPPTPPPNNNLILESWYMVTASVGVIPSNALGVVGISIVVDGLLRNGIVMKNPGVPFSLPISCLLEVPIFTDIKIQVTNNTGASIDLDVGANSNYWKLKQIPGQAI